MDFGVAEGLDQGGNSGGGGRPDPWIDYVKFFTEQHFIQRFGGGTAHVDFGIAEGNLGQGGDGIGGGRADLPKRFGGGTAHVDFGIAEGNLDQGGNGGGGPGQGGK